MKMLDIHIKKKLRSYDLEVTFRVPASALYVLIGPSGSGKTSLLRMIAGLDRPDEGRIVYGSEVWFDSASGINRPVQKRRLGYVFQEYTLFPHLSLLNNAAFACTDRTEAIRWMTLLGIEHLASRKPHQVSGGERQRCAICQALARRPGLLLLDEPFSALDCVTRSRMREDTKRLRHQMTSPVIYVTHDIAEALALADVIVPMVQGKVDKNWLKSAITPTPDVEYEVRGVRRWKLALT